MQKIANYIEPVPGNQKSRTSGPPKSPSKHELYKYNKTQAEFERRLRNKILNANSSRNSSRKGSQDGLSIHLSKYTGERVLSKDQMKQKMLDKMKEAREGPRQKVHNKDLHKIYS